jgi:hypothetical protein
VKHQAGCAGRFFRAFEPWAEQNSGRMCPLKAGYAPVRQPRQLKTVRWTCGFTGAYLKFRKKTKEIKKIAPDNLLNLIGNRSRQVSSVLVCRQR